MLNFCPLPNSKATPTFLGVYYCSIPLPAFKIYASYLLLCNKLPPKLRDEKNKYLLSYSLGGSGIWVQLNWILCLKIPLEAVIKVSAGTVGSFEGSTKGESAS